MVTDSTRTAAKLDVTVEPGNSALAQPIDAPARRLPASDAVAETPAPAAALGPDASRPTPARRLIVAVPDLSVAESDLARRIWIMAGGRPLTVMYVAAASRAEDEYRTRQQLATLAALTRDRQTQVETRLYASPDWLRIVRDVWQDGDQFVCLAEQTVSRRGAGLQPLGQAIASALGVPVYVLSGFHLQAPSSAPRRKSRVMTWGVSLIMVAAFFLLQVSIEQTVKDWARMVLLGLTVVVEMGLIGMWNHYQD